MAQQTAQQPIRPLPDLKFRQQRFRWRRLLPLLVGLLLFWLWVGLTRQPGALSFVLPPPEAVAEQFAALIGNGTLPRHIGVTLMETLTGLAAGVSAAFLLGYGIARSRLLEQTLGPYAVGLQAIPLVAIAPVLTLLFGPGPLTNATIAALIVFFPMLVSTIVGMRNIDADLRDLMRSLNATHWQHFTRLELPAALPVLIGGLKISTTLAVAGAVVGEAISSESGLGFLIYSARYVYNTARIWVGIFTLVALALLLYEMVARLERRLLTWQHAGRHSHN